MEIATWSMILSKISIGKTSNECPTKAEILAYNSSIQISGTYGSAECVMLQDIDYNQSYNYYISVSPTSLSFAATASTKTVTISSYRKEVVNGVEQSGTENINYTASSNQSWCTVSSGNITVTANNSASSRTAVVTYTQATSGKTATVSITQAAGTKTYSAITITGGFAYGVIPAGGGTVTPSAVTYSQTWGWNGATTGGGTITSGASLSYSGTSVNTSTGSVTAPSLGTTVKAQYTFTTATVTVSLNGKTATKQASVLQAANSVTYGNPVVSMTYGDISAAGSTVTPTVSFTQSMTYTSGSTGTNTSGGTKTFSGTSVNTTTGAVTASSLGTTIKSRTKITTSSVTVTVNGKSGSKSVDVYQAENKITSTTTGSWTVSVSANPTIIAATGGTSTITRSATAPKTNHYSSGATSSAGNATGTPTLSISGTGFTLSGTTVTASANNTESTRSCTVTATYSGVSKTTTITQNSASVSYTYTFTVSPTSLSFAATGSTQNVTVTSTKQKLVNGSPSGSATSVGYSRTNGSNVSGTGVAVTMGANNSASTRSGSVTFTQEESGKKVTVTTSQSAGTKSYSAVTVTLGSVADVPASGGSATKPTVSYSQTWGWNGSTTGGGTITTGGTVSWNPASISGSSLGTTVKARTSLGTWTCTVALNGKSGSKAVTVYQAENKVTNTANGTPTIDLQTNTTSVAYSGGTVNVTKYSVSRVDTRTYSSGSKDTVTTSLGNAALSVSGTGFSLSGTTITVSANNTATNRTGTISATYSGATTKTITITQSAATDYLFQCIIGSEWGTTANYNLGVEANKYGSSTPIAVYFKSSVNNGATFVPFHVVQCPEWLQATETTMSDPVGSLSAIWNDANTGNERTGQVIYQQDYSGLQCIITVTQDTGFYLKVIDTEISTDYKAQGFQITVDSRVYSSSTNSYVGCIPTAKNLPSTVIFNNAVATSGTTYIMSFRTTPNDSKNDRQIQLTIGQSNGSKLTDTATLNQLGVRIVNISCYIRTTKSGNIVIKKLSDLIDDTINSSQSSISISTKGYTQPITIDIYIPYESRNEFDIDINDIMLNEDIPAVTEEYIKPTTDTSSPGKDAYVFIWKMNPNYQINTSERGYYGKNQIDNNFILTGNTPAGNTLLATMTIMYINNIIPNSTINVYLGEL